MIYTCGGVWSTHVEGCGLHMWRGITESLDNKLFQFSKVYVTKYMLQREVHCIAKQVMPTVFLEFN